MGSDAVRIRLLGPFRVEGVEVSAFGSRKARSLVKRLAVARGRSVAADTLAEDLWADRPPAKPMDQLSVLASRSRSALGTACIEHSAAGYRLHYDWLDLDEVDQLAEQAADAVGSGRAPSARAAASAALRLLQAPVLEDEPDSRWADEERARLDQLMGRLASIAAEAELAAGDPTTAATLAERALTGDPYDERMLRVLMRAHQRAGRPASALAAYARTRDLLRDELGVSPAAETEAVHTAVLLDEGPGGGERSRVPVGADGEPGVLVGRHDELAHLDGIRAAAASGGGLRVVMVTGEAGIGKSSLLRRWAADARAAGLTVLSGTADRAGPGLALQPVLDALATFLAAQEPSVADALVGAEAAVLDPLLGRRSPAPEPSAGGSDGVDVVDAEAARLVLFTAITTVVERIHHHDRDGERVPGPERPPTIMILDDVDAAGSTTAAWVRFARRRLVGVAMVLVVAVRPDERAAGDGLGPDLTIELGPLGVDAAADLVGGERAAELVERSGGHPLFLVELAASDPGELPTSIRDAVSVRLRQSAALAPVVEAAAVLGAPVDLDLLAGVLEAPPGELLGSLEQGVHRRFLDESGTSFVFHHELVQQAVAAGVSASRRAFLHRRAAHLLSERPDADPFAMAEHARLGGDLPLASRALVAAAARATDAFDYDDALRLLDEAIELDDSVEARRRRAIVELCLGRFAEAGHDAETAAERDPRPEVLELAAWAAYYQRDFDRALRYGEWVTTVPDAGAAAAAGHTVMGRILHARGQLTDAEAHLTAALGDDAPEKRAVATIWLAAVRNHQGRSADALDLLHHGLRPGIVFTQPFAPVHGLFDEGYALALLGRADEALRAFDQAAAVVATRGQTRRYNEAILNYRSWVVRYLGCFEEADAGNTRAREESSLLEATAQAVVDLVDGCLHRGDLAGAAALLDEAATLQAVDHGMRWRHVLRSQLLRARLAIADGRYDDARGLAAGVTAEAATVGLPRYAALAALTDQWAAGAAGEHLDLGTIHRRLQELDAVAGLEGWWWAVQLARVTGDDALRRLAVDKVAILAARAGDRAPRLTAAADRLLGT